MTYNVSEMAVRPATRWAGPTLVVMGIAHLALSPWGVLGAMARHGWWHTATTPERGQAVWFAVGGGSLVTMGLLARELAAAGREVPRSAAAVFAATLAATFAATGMVGAAAGAVVGAVMLARPRLRGSATRRGLRG